MVDEELNLSDVGLLLRPKPPPHEAMHEAASRSNGKASYKGGWDCEVGLDPVVAIALLKSSPLTLR